MEMEMRGLLPQGKHLFNQRWGDLQSLTGKDKKLWLRVVKVARKCCKRSWVKEKSGGTFLQTTTKGSWGTQHRGASICEIQKSVINLGGTTQTQIDVVLVEQWGRDWFFFNITITQQVQSGFQPAMLTTVRRRVNSRTWCLTIIIVLLLLLLIVSSLGKSVVSRTSSDQMNIGWLPA